MNKNSVTNEIRAVFIDRDGVLTPEHSSGQPSEPVAIEGISNSLNLIAAAGFVLVMVTNQPAVARGLTTEERVVEFNDALLADIANSGGPDFLSAEYCPHHPSANLRIYRVVCDCRKPKPGMLISAASAHGILLRDSFMIGDRITDVVAGNAAGVKTVLIDAGPSTRQMIETDFDISGLELPDYSCHTLEEAAVWIVNQS